MPQSGFLKLPKKFHRSRSSSRIKRRDLSIILCLLLLSIDSKITLLCVAWLKFVSYQKLIRFINYFKLNEGNWYSRPIDTFGHAA
uniref:Uncharacterized protein n=1 Tax=Romanomermis culicivorax TaxID=13658 RepID=A0A915IEV6_ROMCU